MGYLRDLFLMEEKLLGMLFPLVRHSNETSKYVQLAIPPHLEVSSFNQPKHERGWSKERKVVERLVGNKLHIFSLVERLQDLLPKMLNQIEAIGDKKALKKITDALSKYQMPEEEDFTARHTRVSGKQFSDFCIEKEESSHQNSRVKEKFKVCRYETNLDASFKLSPLKMENLSEEIEVLHEVLTESQVNTILNHIAGVETRQDGHKISNDKSNFGGFARNIMKLLFKTEDSLLLHGFAPGTHVSPSFLKVNTYLLFLNNSHGQGIIFPDIGINFKHQAGSILWLKKKREELSVLYGHCTNDNGVKWVLSPKI